QRQSAEASRTSGAAVLAAVDPLVSDAPADRELVLVERLLHVDERALPTAIRVVLQRGDRHVGTSLAVHTVDRCPPLRLPSPGFGRGAGGEGPFRLPVRHQQPSLVRVMPAGSESSSTTTS